MRDRSSSVSGSNWKEKLVPPIVIAGEATLSAIGTLVALSHPDESGRSLDLVPPRAHTRRSGRTSAHVHSLPRLIATHATAPIRSEHPSAAGDRESLRAPG